MKTTWIAFGPLMCAMFSAAALPPSAWPARFVRNTDGKLLAGAVVHVLDATVPAEEWDWARSAKEREQAVCPPTFAGVGKSVTTDAAGRYAIEELDPRLRYEFAVSAPGHRAHLQYALITDAGGALVCTLEARPARGETAVAVTGIIQDEDGRPLSGAVLRIRGEERIFGGGREYRSGGSFDKVDNTAVTEADGSYLIIADRADRHFDVFITASGYAPQAAQLITGAEPPPIRLARGCTVTGRLLKDGKPLAGVAICIAQNDRSEGRSVGIFRVGTDDNGRFTFHHLPGTDRFDLWASMGSLGSRGATASARVDTPSGFGGTDRVDAGDLKVVPALTIRGRVRLPDGAKLPKSGVAMLQVLYSCNSVSVPLDVEGNFEIRGIPRGLVDLRLQIGGFSISPDNASYSQLALTGLVETDIDLIVKLKDGDETGVFNNEVRVPYDVLHKRILEGVSAEPVK
jgi:hypothetical protein